MWQQGEYSVAGVESVLQSSVNKMVQLYIQGCEGVKYRFWTRRLRRVGHQ